MIELFCHESCIGGNTIIWEERVGKRRKRGGRREGMARESVKMEDDWYSRMEGNEDVTVSSLSLFTLLHSFPHGELWMRDRLIMR